VLSVMGLSGIPVRNLSYEKEIKCLPKRLCATSNSNVRSRHVLIVCSSKMAQGDGLNVGRKSVFIASTVRGGWRQKVRTDCIGFPG
jgi:hypothetical protein